MPSPSPIPTTDPRLPSSHRTLLNQSMTMTKPRSMTTTLFNYQKKSVWKMLQREIHPQNVLAPDFLECQSAEDGREPYWLEMTSGRVFKEPVFWTDGTGGIICEDMGTGKTCICISLILHTRHQISTPPIDCPIYVTLSTPHLDGANPPNTIDEAPSLKALAAIATLTSRTPYRHLKRAGLPPHLYKLLRHSPAWYWKYPSTGGVVRRRGRSLSGGQGVRVFVSSATLVVVPDTLVNQWRSELNKHTDGSVKLLVITDTNASIPPALELISYDIVLISYPRFGLEQRRGGLDIFSPSQGCECVGECVCGGGTYRSPLLEVRWLRLIVDEGHAMARKVESSSVVMLASLLECDRRWVCTGTPMPNILQREVVEEEAKDVERFGMLLTEFLKVEPFASLPSRLNFGRGFIFARLPSDEYRMVIAKPFLEHGFRGYEKLKTLMERVMVRNRMEDIERDIQLPPLHTTITPLPFTTPQRHLHNALLSQIATNAVLSQRTDQDYFFHPSNRKFLRHVVDNLHQSCFWYTAGEEFLEQVRSTMENVLEGLEWVKRGDVEYGEEDVRCLKRVRRVLRGVVRSEV
ncbi:hypothetical protein HDV00_010481, partial [Rhizophlyctis rosea]